MSDLINIDMENQTVSARELHEKLNIGTAFKDWFPRMAEYGFVEGTDFNMLKIERVQMEGSREVRREVTDYNISVDMAKQICMIQRTPEGKAVRQYLIDLEKAWNTPEQVFARALRMADQTISSLKDRCKFLGGQVVEQQKVIEQLEPKASYYDLILQCKDLIATTVIAKDYGYKKNSLFNYILDVITDYSAERKHDRNIRNHTRKLRKLTKEKQAEDEIPSEPEPEVPESEVQDETSYS